MNVKLQEYMCIHQGKMNEEYMCNMICNMCHLDCTTCGLVDLTTLSNSCASVDVLIEPWYEPRKMPYQCTMDEASSFDHEGRCMCLCSRLQYFLCSRLDMSSQVLINKKWTYDMFKCMLVCCAKRLYKYLSASWEYMIYVSVLYAFDVEYGST